MNVVARIGVGAGEVVEHPCAFTDEEWSRLTAFRTYAEELSTTRLLSTPGRIDFGLRWTEESGEVHFEGRQLPNDDDLRAYLHLLRPFVLASEPTFYPRVRNLVVRELRATPLEPLLDAQLATFFGRHWEEQFRMMSDGVVLNSDEMLMRWLNAYEYHRDEDKRREIEDHHNALPFAFSRATWTAMALDKARAVVELAGWVMAMEKGWVCQPIAVGIAQSKRS